MNRNSEPTIIKVGRLADGLSGMVQERMAVRVSGGGIEWVARQSELSQCGDIEGTVLDFPGATLMPGLIDCHTHTNMPGTGLSVDEVHEDGDDIHLMEAVKSARMALESGVTTMRDNGGWNKVVFSLMEGIRRDIVPGPRIVACGNPVTMTGGHCWMMGAEADGVDGVRAAVRRMIKNGASFIKVMTSGGTTRGSMPERASYTVEELRAVVEEAHLRGKLVAGHAISTQAVVYCLDAGVDMIIHCNFMDEDGVSRWAPRVGERIAESGVWINPTIHIRRAATLALEAKRDEGTISVEERMELEENEETIRQRGEVFRELVSAGARLIGGSDCGWGAYPFGQFHRELDSMVDVGMPTEQAFLSGTRDAAQALGLQGEIGTIEPGKEADLLLVDGDPTQDLKVLGNVVGVFRAGERVR